MIVSKNQTERLLIYKSSDVREKCLTDNAGL